MKKLLYILICFLYLTSSVGYASIEHYCHAMHERSMHSGDCCCSHSYCAAVGSTTDSPTHCCAANIHAEQNEKAGEALSSGECCENFSHYYQINEPATRESNSLEMPIIDEPTTLLSPDIVKLSTLYKPLKLSSHPAFRLNLPLLN